MPDPVTIGLGMSIIVILFVVAIIVGFNVNR